MDDLDKLWKKLRETQRESEIRVANRHRDGNQVIYGGYRRYDCDESESDRCV